MTDITEGLRALHADAQRRLEHLDGVLQELRYDRGAESADDEHDPEGATLSGEWSRLAGLRAAAAAEVAEAESALDRVENGSYGVCVDCGRDIPPARLEARPTALRCVDCETSRR